MSLPIIAVHWTEWMLRSSRRSFTAFRMTVLWGVEKVPDENRGWMVDNWEFRMKKSLESLLPGAIPKCF